MRYLEHSPKSIAICGMGPSLMSYMMEAMSQDLKLDYADEVWAINAAANVLYHDVCFWMDDLEEENKVRPDLFKLMNKRGKPVITSTAYPNLVPTSCDYPIQQIGHLSHEVFGKIYLNNGLAMMVAYALFKGVKVIRMFGADFTYPNRGHAETGRACVEAWMCVANKFGTRIVIPRNTSLFDTVAGSAVYGYRTQPKIVLPSGQEIDCGEPSILAEYVPPDSTTRPEAPAA